jgi:hypothetical protein
MLLGPIGASRSIHYSRRAPGGPSFGVDSLGCERWRLAARSLQKVLLERPVRKVKRFLAPRRRLIRRRAIRDAQRGAERAAFWNTEGSMPEQETIERAKQDEEEGKAPTTQAGEFVREEIHHVREGKHGARSTKQAIAIGLSKARRAGVELPPPKADAASEEVRRKAARDVAKGRRGVGRPSGRRSRAVSQALKREGRAAAAPEALARQARSAARTRSGAERSAAAKKAARTKGPSVRSAAARKAASTRGRRRG